MLFLSLCWTGVWSDHPCSAGLEPASAGRRNIQIPWGLPVYCVTCWCRQHFKKRMDLTVCQMCGSVCRSVTCHQIYLIWYRQASAPDQSFHYLFDPFFKDGKWKEEAVFIVSYTSIRVITNTRALTVATQQILHKAHCTIWHNFTVTQQDEYYEESHCQSYPPTE